MPLRNSDQNDVKISRTGRYAVFDSGLFVYRYDFATRSLVHCSWPASNTAPSIDDRGTKVLVGTVKGLFVCHFPDGALVAHVDVFPKPAWTYQPQFDPAMSGDGQVVAYRGRNRGRFALFAKVLPAGTPTKIADLGVREDSSATTVMFSRDGTKLAYSDAQGRIWLASISAAPFEGTVSDSRGSPLAAQGVSLKNAGVTVAQDTTDASGSFALAAPSGSYTVELSGSIGVRMSYKFRVPRINLTKGNEVALALPTRTVTAAVTGPTGAAISSAVVHLGATPTSFPFLGGKASGTESADGVTEKAGRVALEMLPAAAAKLTVTPAVGSGLAVATVSFVPKNGRVVHVRLRPGRKTATTVTSSRNPSVYGQQVTLKATVKPVTGTGSPAGTVQFYDGKTKLGSPVTLRGRKALFVTSALLKGKHSISAVYGGDSRFTSSTSNAVRQTVN